METAREASVNLTSDVSSLGEGRRFVARTLREWHVDEDRIQPVRLVANELVANAIVHARSAPVLSLEASRTEVMLRVADSSRDMPIVRNASTDAASGRGLILVQALADRWGIDAGAAGKTVWATFGCRFS